MAKRYTERQEEQREAFVEFIRQLMGKVRCGEIVIHNIAVAHMIGIENTHLGAICRGERKSTFEKMYRFYAEASQHGLIFGKDQTRLAQILEIKLNGEFNATINPQYDPAWISIKDLLEAFKSSIVEKIDHGPPEKVARLTKRYQTICAEIDRFMAESKD